MNSYLTGIVMEWIANRPYPKGWDIWVSMELTGNHVLVHARKCCVSRFLELKIGGDAEEWRNKAEASIAEMIESAAVDYDKIHAVTPHNKLPLDMIVSFAELLAKAAEHPNSSPTLEQARRQFFASMDELAREDKKRHERPK